VIQPRSKLCTDTSGIQYFQRLTKMVQRVIDWVLFKFDFKWIAQLSPHCLSSEARIAHPLLQLVCSFVVFRQSPPIELKLSHSIGCPWSWSSSAGWVY
jgi:hypothetical protein